MDSSAQTYLTLIRLCNGAKRHDDMYYYAVKRIQLGKEAEKATEQERNLFSVAFKNVIGKLKSKRKVLSDLKTAKKDKQEDTKVVDHILSQVEQELVEKSSEVIELIKDYLLPYSSSTEERVLPEP